MSTTENTNPFAAAFANATEIELSILIDGDNFDEETILMGRKFGEPKVNDEREAWEAWMQAAIDRLNTLKQG